MKTDNAPDWGRLIDDLLAKGMSTRGIAGTMGLTMMTESMLRSYREGVQPMWWRGDALVRMWCDVMTKERTDIPMVPVIRGRRGRIARLQQERAPVINLPNWPPAPKPQPKTIKRKVAA